MATPVKTTLNKKSVQEKNSQFEGVNELPLVVIVGPTASGKSATAMRIAEEFNGEIICADSRTIYKYMNIGTAKPSEEDRVKVPHWGLDLVEPGERFTAADFKYFAQQKILEIRERGHLPMIVGGTGLYIDGVIFDYEFIQSDAKLHKKLELLSLEELTAYCADNNVLLPKNQQNRRHLITAIEHQNISLKRLNEPIANTVVVGITTNSDELRARITIRAEQLFQTGMVEEAKMLGKKYGWNSEAMTGNIYRLVHQYLEGEFDEAELKRRNITADWQLAKRQLTWLKRNQFIHWKSLDDAYIYIKEQLSLPAGN
ncbi:MAG: tRNA (adenosine(37)-N6)-dimethylallyltransferase [Candidatus Saccharimonadaceae bacterium]